MKSRTAAAALVAAIALFSPARATTYDAAYARSGGTHVSASVGFFYDALAPHGTWVDTGPYGWAWCPLDVPVGWRPYSVGYWAYSDWGWMWVAEDPWGWIPYHYGRWAFDSYYGWIWVPGDVWAPAWVAWRYGGGWVGWAPLPPDVGWSASVGISFTSYDLDRGIDRFGWCFVRDRDFGHRLRRLDPAPASRNVTLLHRTRNVTRYVSYQNVPVERGLRPELIERATGRSIAKYRVTESRRPLGGRGAVIRGRTIEVYRPGGRVAQELRDRLREAPPPERRVAPRRLIERQERERRQLDRHWTNRRAQLEREHQREIRRPPRGVPRAELRRKHEAEMRAQRELEQRQRQVIESREKRLRERDDRKEESEARGRGRGRGRG